MSVLRSRYAIEIPIKTSIFLTILSGILYLSSPELTESPMPPSQPAIPKKKPEALAERHCLARNIYHEARGDGVPSQIAVALNTQARVVSTKYPDSTCAVVYQPYQYSWTLENPREIIDEEAFRSALNISQAILVASASTHYHASSISPRWSESMEEVGRVGSHIYYRED